MQPRLAAQIGAQPFLAFTLSALADALSTRGALGDDTRAAGHRRRASELARRLGLARLDASLTPKTGVWWLRSDEDGWELRAGAERARVNVTRTLRATISQISAKAPLAAAHLDASISTGRACRYQPGAGGPARWML